MAEVITMPRLFGYYDGRSETFLLKSKLISVQDFESEINGTLLYQGVAEGGQSSGKITVYVLLVKEGEDSGGPQLIRGAPAKEESPAQAVADLQSAESTASAGSACWRGNITMPRLSDTMTERKVAKWHKNVGDRLRGDLLAEIETLIKAGVAEGGQAPVDTVLCIIGKEGEGYFSINRCAPAKEESPAQAVAELQQAESTASAEVPAGVEIITMPRKGDILQEIETDKAVQDFDSEFKRTLLYQGVAESGAANWLHFLAIIGPKEQMFPD
ncbi:hypothetical protein FQR65_LT14985 [Abscondita terminalis]|nr:hypothetical protein FQR65_LT14985 [Abscondita terminalis]